MIRIGIIGSPQVSRISKIKKIIDDLRNTYGNMLEIVTGGNTEGIEREARKIALELSISYTEFNPGHTRKNMYSALGEEYYNRPFHPTHYIGRYMKMVKHCDAFVVFRDVLSTDPVISSVISFIKKNKKQVVIIDLSV